MSRSSVRLPPGTEAQRRQEQAYRLAIILGGPAAARHEDAALLDLKGRAACAALAAHAYGEPHYTVPSAVVWAEAVENLRRWETER